MSDKIPAQEKKPIEGAANPQKGPDSLVSTTDTQALKGNAASEQLLATADFSQLEQPATEAAEKAIATESPGPVIEPPPPEATKPEDSPAYSDGNIVPGNLASVAPKGERLETVLKALRTGGESAFEAAAQAGQLHEEHAQDAGK